MAIPCTVVIDSGKNLLRIFTSRQLAIDSIKSWYKDEDIKLDVDTQDGAVKVCWNNAERQHVYYVQTQYIDDEIS